MNYLGQLLFGWENGDSESFNNFSTNLLSHKSQLFWLLICPFSNLMLIKIILMNPNSFDTEKEVAGVKI